MVLFVAAALITMPLTAFARAELPTAFNPMVLPATTLPLVPLPVISTPLAELPLMPLPAYREAVGRQSGAKALPRPPRPTVAARLTYARAVPLKRLWVLSLLT